MGLQVNFSQTQNPDTESFYYYLYWSSQVAKLSQDAWLHLILLLLRTFNKYFQKVYTVKQ